MSERKITFLLGIILFCIFAGLLGMQYYTFYGSHPTFPEKIGEVIAYAEESKWDEASQTLQEVENTWNNAQYLIAIKYADQEYSLLNIAFKGLRAGINSQNRHEVLKEGEVCMMLFKNITSFSSAP